MKLKLSLLSLLSGAIVLLGNVDGGNILVWPAEGSHWINLKPVLEVLIDRGHSVTVLLPNATLYMDSSKPERFSFLHFNASISEKDFTDFLEEFLEFEMYEARHMNILQKHLKLFKLLVKDQDFFLRYCDGVLKSPAVMEKLREGKFDMILADPLYPCAELAAEVLGLPFVFTFRFSFAHTLERMCGQLPAPPSYVPGTISQLTDKMSFFERIGSLLFYATQDAMAVSLWKRYDSYYTEYLVLRKKGKGHIYCTSLFSLDFYPEKNNQLMKSKLTLAALPLIKMKVTPVLLSLISVALSGFRNVDGGHVLVWPTEGSHWINLKPVLETLTNRGHKVTVLVPSATLFMDPSEEKRFSFLTFNVSISTQDLDDLIHDILRFEMYEVHQMNTLQKHAKFYELFSKEQDFVLKYCDGVLKSPAVMDKLRGGKVDMILVDPIYACAELVAEVIGVPFVYTYRYSSAHTMERLCGQTPAPPSYAPGALSELTDKMSFFERVVSLLFYLTQDAMAINLWKKYDAYYTEYLGRPASYCELTGKADIWLIRTYWDFEYPRPLLPNFVYVGGMHCRPAKPLPQDLEEFVQSSGDDGVVVFTLGSFIRNMTKEKSNIFASAFAQIPQKVVWKYSGEKPDTLAPNTRIYDWIPQNDLLGHPKTRVFVTHGGTNGIYEAIYHGVPMLGIPMFADQPDNMVHMKAKGAALYLEFSSMQTQDLVDALKTVINDPTYKENAMRLSRIHHDRPVKPLDEAVFWVEYVMRHKGAGHLRVAAHKLAWYEYHCLDVLLLLVSALALVVYVFIKTCSFFIRRCCLRPKRKNKKE